jgi:putative ABC transport system permease protein
MFWRVWLRSLAVRRPQSALALAALALGAAVASMLLNVYGDAHRKMQEEFRAYGPNLILAPAGIETSPGASSGSLGGLMDREVLGQIQDKLLSLGPVDSKTVAVPVLYVVASAQAGTSSSLPASNLVAVGTNFAALKALNPAWRLSGALNDLGSGACALGAHAATRLGLKTGDLLRLTPLTAGPGPSAGGRSAVCSIAGLVASGAGEDDQVFLPLGELQEVAGLPGGLSLIETRVAARPAELNKAVDDLQQEFPSLAARPVREIVQSEGEVLATIRGLALTLAALILGVVVLCVMATVTAIVLERRKEVAVMKALGASDRTVFGLLLAELGALGLAGGLAGFVLGALLAHRLGVELFGVALNTAWWTLVPVLAAALLVAAIPALVPVSTVRNIDPARTLRGE